MSRIPLVEAEAAPPAVRAVYDRMEKIGLPLFNVFKLFGNDARLLGGFAEIPARFSSEEQIDLCATVGLSSMVNRFHATFRTDVDEATQAGAGDISFCPVGY